jgi:hypothetical protein
MKVVPLVAVASQQINITLNGQACSINVYQKSTGIYFDLFFNNAPVRTTVRCLNESELLADAQYLGFVGDFMFVDTQGDTDPTYTGFGPEPTGRYQLVYLEASDLG